MYEIMIDEFFMDGLILVDGGSCFVVRNHICCLYD